MSLPTMRTSFHEKYLKGPKLGEGTFGEVFHGTCRGTGNVVAMKRCKDATDHIPMSLIREIKHLDKINHVNVVELIEVCLAVPSNGGTDIYMVFGYCSCDLETLIGDEDFPLGLGKIKDISLQICLGIQHVHDRSIMHLDLKPANILVTDAGVVKIADFGSSRTMIKNDLEDGYPKQIPYHVTSLLYSAPEVLLMRATHGREVDMWSVGCIIAELFLRTPIFQGETRMEVLQDIIKKCGSDHWVEWLNLNLNHVLFLIRYPIGQPGRLDEVFSRSCIDEYGVLLLKDLFDIDPKDRASSCYITNDKFFARVAAA